MYFNVAFAFAVKQLSPHTFHDCFKEPDGGTVNYKKKFKQFIFCLAVR